MGDVLWQRTRPAPATGLTATAAGWSRGSIETVEASVPGRSLFHTDASASASSANATTPECDGTHFMPTVQEQLEAGVRQHVAGCLSAARQHYEQVLREEPQHPDALHLCGVIAQQLGQPLAAVDFIRRAIHANPNSALYHSNHAAALLRLRQFAEAISAAARAVELDPRHADALDNLQQAHRQLAVQLQNEGRLVDARQHAEEAIRLNPRDVAGWILIGNIDRQLNLPEAAEGAYRKAVFLAPSGRVAHFSLANLLCAEGRLEDAIAVYHRGLALGNPASHAGGAGQHLVTAPRPGMTSQDRTATGLHVDPPPDEQLLDEQLLDEQLLDEQLLDDATLAEVWFSLGTACLGVEQLDEAVEALQRADQLLPGQLRIRLNLGAALRECGQLDEAECVLRELVRTDSDRAEPLVNLAAVLTAQGEFTQAVDCCEQALQLEPDSTWATLNLARATAKPALTDELLAAAHQAVQVGPAEPEACFELGNLCRAGGNPEQAEAAYRQALELKPAFREARFNRSLALLSLGRLAEGWDEYEWRFGTQIPPVADCCPLWNAESLGSRTILVQQEQGIGDEIMFASCLPDLTRAAGHVVLECSPRLRSLFQRSFPRVSVAGEQYDAADQPPLDYRTPAGSLPRFFRRTAEEFPRRAAWLTADSRRVARFRQLVPREAGKWTVGIAWRGGKQPAVQSVRSTVLADWRELATDDRLRLISLQYGDCLAELEEAAAAGLRIEPCPEIDPLHDLDGLAALIGSLDLVISVDNATVHLAGALGCEVWTLLPFSADWRWLSTGSESLWYPSMRLFRQPAPGDWAGVFTEVAAQLETRMAQVTPPP